jgi:hypothetical protein
MESLLQDHGGLLCLAAVACKALLDLQAVPVSGFGMFFGASFG